MKDQITLVCQGCDLMLTLDQDSQQPTRGKVVCPRCHTQLAHWRPVQFQMIIALSLAGLLLFVPAIFMPFISLKIMGQQNMISVMDGVIKLAQMDFWLMAILIFFCAILAPLVLLLFGLVISWAHFYVRSDRLFRYLLQCKVWLSEWSMLDVYFLGVLVSYIKLKDLGGLESFYGLYCFIGMMLISMLSIQWLDHVMLWHRRGGEAGYESNYR